MLSYFYSKFLLAATIFIVFVTVACAQNENDVRTVNQIPFTANWKYDNTITTHWNTSCGGKEFSMTARGKPDYSIEFKVDGQLVSDEVTDTLEKVFIKDGNALAVHNLSCATHDGKFGYMLMLNGLIRTENDNQLIAVERTVQVVDDKISNVSTLDILPILQRDARPE
jgi:hypothetical protein